MKKNARPFLLLIIVILAVFLCFLIWRNYDAQHPSDAVAETPASSEDIVSVTADPLPSQTPEPTPTLPSEELSGGEENYAVANIAVGGDIVVHSGINAEAQNAEGYDYTTIFGGAKTFLQQADYAICTMETTFSGGPEYTGYPMFTSPDALAYSMRDVGIDMVNLASNHCMDSYQSGLNRTIQVFDELGMDHIGTYASQEARDANNGIVVKDINGISIAFLSYTYGTNGMPVTGFEYAVNIFFNDYLTNLSDINYDMLTADMAAARALDTDMIIVMMHWGNEYYTSPVDYQTELADFLFAEGADIILGGHVHVPEPMEIREVVDNEGNEKTGFIVYCLGNFISCQNDRYTKITGVLNLEIVKDLTNGDTKLNSVNYVPMFMVDLGDYGIEASWRYQLWNLHEAINAYDSGNDWGVITPALYDELTGQLDDLHSIFDPSLDLYNQQ